MEGNEKAKEEYIDNDPIKHWDIAYKTAKKNIASEEKVLEDVDKYLKLLEEDTKDKEEQLELEKEENELCMKLYPEFGEEYHKSPVWRDYMVKKKFKFIQKMNGKRKANLRKSHSMKVKDAQQRVSEAKEMLVKYKVYLKEAIEGKTNAKKDKTALVG